MVSGGGSLGMVATATQRLARDCNRVLHEQAPGPYQQQLPVLEDQAINIKRAIVQLDKFILTHEK
jgi:hypothetical protein